MADQAELTGMLKSIGDQLLRRAAIEHRLDRYVEGDAPLPDVIIRAKITRAYMLLMGMAHAPWGGLVVDSVQNRLEVTGIESPDDEGGSDTDDALWGIWQENQLDAESKLAHKTALIAGRAFALVWPDKTGAPKINLDGPGQMIVKYEEGSRRDRVAAMRYWLDADDQKPYANLYLKDGIYKFIGPQHASGPNGIEWQRRDVPDEPWPVPNPFGVVPVVEFPVNRRLRPGSFAYARGEFEHCTSLIDRIHLLTFLGLVVAFWAGFPLRAIIGDRILRDDDNNPLPPFEVAADQIVQLENPDAKLASFAAAERSGLSIYDELGQLASLTSTPRTVFPDAGGISNISADTIRGLEGGLVAKIPGHKASLGEGWEETLRLAGLMSPDPVVLSTRAELQWTDHETRSLAERADAASKLATILPQAALLEYVLNLTGDQIARYKAEQAGDVMGQLLTAALKPAVPTPEPGQPAPASGNGGPPNEPVLPTGVTGH